MAATESDSRNIVRHHGGITAADRERLLGQRGCIVWLTGLSGSGKSTIGYALEERLVRAGHAACVLDGDNLRHGLNGDLGFSAEDRAENIRRVGEVAILFADAGLITISAFISPYRRDRQRLRETAGHDRFVEVYVQTPLEVCQQRDPKGLYAKALAGEIQDFTGIDAPYEAPESPEVILDTQDKTVDECVDVVLSYLAQHGTIMHQVGGQASAEK